MPRKRDPDKLLCHCLTVTWGDVEKTIEEQRCKTVREVTNLCGAGGGCKTCHPEIQDLIDEARARRRGLMKRLARLFGRTGES